MNIDSCEMVEESKNTSIVYRAWFDVNNDYKIGTNDIWVSPADIVASPRTKEVLWYKNKKSFSEALGDMFVIIDWKKGEIYDWVFYGSEKSGFVTPIPIAVGQNPIRYYNTMSGSQQIACLDPEKTSVLIS